MGDKPNKNVHADSFNFLTYFQGGPFPEQAVQFILLLPLLRCPRGVALGSPGLVLIAAINLRRAGTWLTITPKVIDSKRP